MTLDLAISNGKYNLQQATRPEQTMPIEAVAAAAKA